MNLEPWRRVVMKGSWREGGDKWGVVGEGGWGGKNMNREAWGARHAHPNHNLRGSR